MRCQLAKKEEFENELPIRICQFEVEEVQRIKGQLKLATAQDMQFLRTEEKRDQFRGQPTKKKMTQMHIIVRIQ